MHKNMQLMLLRSLRKDQHAVGTNGKRGRAGEAVVRAWCGDHVGARVPCAVFAVPLPIAVEPILITNMRLGHGGVPGAVRLGVHGIPVVERSDDGYVPGMRRLHAERDFPACGIAPMPVRCIAHDWFLITRDALPGSYTITVHCAAPAGPTARFLIEGLSE